MSADHAAAAATTPEPIRSNIPDSFPWGVLHQRHPALIARVRAEFPYPPHIQQALDDLQEEITGTIQPLPRDAPDRADWERWGGADYVGQPWPDVPFLWAESYFYRKLLAAVDYFTPGPWQGIDLFQPQKSAELAEESVTAELAELDELAGLSEEDRAVALTTAAVWGNRADLGFRLSDPESSHRETADLIVNDIPALWQHLAAGAPGTVHLVADNTGHELLADLVLVDHLLRTGRAEQVELHLKSYPYYISDATTADLLACLHRLTTAGGEAAAVGRRLRTALTGGRLQLAAHRFWTTPLTFHDLPPELATRFAHARLVIVKGDLNYRRLVGDLHWPATTSFAAATSYFPGPVVALRTLKSDVVVGLNPDTLARLDSSGEQWRISGTHGMVQLRT